MRGKLSAIVPVYNEEKNIDKCLSSLKSQTYKPIQAIVVDDGSTDESLAHIMRYIGFTVVKRPKHLKGDWNRIPYVLREGSKHVDEDFEYVGILDADTVLEKDYYEKIVSFLNDNPHAGLAGGELLNQPETGKIPYVYGCNRVYTRRCWIKVNDGKVMKPVPIWDTYHNLYARMLGFQPTRFSHAVSYSLRPARKTPPFWKGYGSYQLGYPMWLIVGRSVRNRSVSMLAGYLKAMFSGERQYPVKQVVKMVQAERIRGLFKL